MQRQNELHSDNGQIGFRAYERVDGKVTLAAAIIALKHQRNLEGADMAEKKQQDEGRPGGAGARG
jgi:hypothetical protein